MANCTYGYITSVDSYSDFAAQSMRLTISSLPSLATVKVYATVTSLSGTQTTYLITSAGTTTFPNAKGVTLKIEPLYNDGFAAGSLVGSIKALTSGGSVLGTASVNNSIAAVQNVNYAKDDVGTAGADFLSGDANANDLIGLEGNDVLKGSAGADNMNGGSGTDAVDYSLSAAAVLVTLGGAVSGGDAQGDTLVSIEDVWGSGFADTLAGDGASNRLEGRAGADILSGNGGTDILVGGDGADLLNGGSGADELAGGNDNDTYVVDNVGDVIYEYSGGGTGDLVQTTLNSYTLGGEVELLQFTGAGNFTGTGNALANGITGGSGDDMLNGGAGADVLTGGAGADIFLFTTALGGGNIDTLTDFAVGVDKVHLDDAIFTGLSVGALPADAFAFGTAAGDADDRIIYDAATGVVLFDPDGAGGIAATQFATLSVGLATLSATEFAVI